MGEGQVLLVEISHCILKINYLFQLDLPVGDDRWKQTVDEMEGQ